MFREPQSTRVYLSSRSGSQFAPSREYSPRLRIVRPSAAIVAANRCENAGALRHILHTLPTRLTSYLLETPLSSKYSIEHSAVVSSLPKTAMPLRSEERRVGKECRSRGARTHYKIN